MKKIIVLFALILIIQQSPTLAQESRSGKIGIGYSGMLASKVSDFTLALWLGNNFLLEPQFGFYHLNVANYKGTNWRLGLGALFVVKDFVVVPYIGARVKTIFISGDEEVYKDLVLSLVFGGEYFVSEWFSVGLETRLNYISTDKDLSPAYLVADAKIFETEEVLNIKLYFN